MMTTIAFILFTIFHANSTAQVAAISHPNLSGKWRTNTEESRCPAHVGPLLTRVEIKQQGNELTETAEDSRTGAYREAPIAFSYTLDGGTTTALLRGELYRATARWEGQTVIIVWRVNRGGAEAVMKRELSLSSDGKTLTMKIYSAESQKEPTEILVMDKTQGGN